MHMLADDALTHVLQLCLNLLLLHQIHTMYTVSQKRPTWYCPHLCQILTDFHIFSLAHLLKILQ